MDIIMIKCLTVIQTIISITKATRRKEEHAIVA